MEMNVAAINGALVGIPRERVRLHSCWGNRRAAHARLPDAEAALLYAAKVGALTIEFANPATSTIPGARAGRCRRSSSCFRA